jgi:hypothetical protein
LKDDQGVVGTLNNGLPVHLYNYKGEATPRIGLMADEVEKVSPDSVLTGLGGFKMVNYGKAAHANG